MQLKRSHRELLEGKELSMPQLATALAEKQADDAAAEAAAAAAAAAAVAASLFPSLIAFANFHVQNHQMCDTYIYI